MDKLSKVQRKIVKPLLKEQICLATGKNSKKKSPKKVRGEKNKIIIKKKHGVKRREREREREVYKLESRSDLR